MGSEMCIRDRNRTVPEIQKGLALIFKRDRSVRKGTSRALPKFESYGMLETTAFGGWKAKEAIEWLHGIGRLVPDLDKWDAEAVAVRQRALAHLAIGAWPT